MPKTSQKLLLPLESYRFEYFIHLQKNSLFLFVISYPTSFQKEVLFLLLCQQQLQNFSNKLYSLMLPQLGLKSVAFTKASSGKQLKSPYLMQYKVFQQRLKRQEKQWKCPSYVPKCKKSKSHIQEDYLQIAKQILNKKQNLCIFSEYVFETEPSIDTKQYSQSLATKVSGIHIKMQSNNNNANKTSKGEALSEIFDYTTYQNSRIKSQATTNIIRVGKPKSNYVSFIGYKRNKKAMMDQEIRKVNGLN